VFQIEETAAKARPKFFIRTPFCQGFNLARKALKQTDEPDVSLRQMRAWQSAKTRSDPRRMSTQVIAKNLQS
jgi:hypothetical protein